MESFFFYSRMKSFMICTSVLFQPIVYSFVQLRKKPKSHKSCFLNFCKSRKTLPPISSCNRLVSYSRVYSGPSKEYGTDMKLLLGKMFRSGLKSLFPGVNSFLFFNACDAWFYCIQCLSSESV